VESPKAILAKILSLQPADGIKKLSLSGGLTVYVDIPEEGFDALHNYMMEEFRVLVCNYDDVEGD